MAWLALLALMVQCLLPISHALAMARASQDDPSSLQFICSFHEAASAANLEQGNERDKPVSDALAFCPLCQMGAMGHSLALPSQAFEAARLDVSPLILKHEYAVTQRIIVADSFDPSRPRGPPTVL